MDSDPFEIRPSESATTRDGSIFLRASLNFLRFAGGSRTLAGRLQLTILTSVLILVANVGSGIVLARALGPSGRGIFTAATLIGPLVATIGGLGIADALVYSSGKTSEAKSPALVTALYIGAAQSLVLVLLGWGLVLFMFGGTSRPAAYWALVYLVSIPLFPLSLYPQAVLQGRLRLAQFNLARAAVHVINTGVLVTLWLLGIMTVGVAIGATLVSSAAACVLSLVAAASLTSSKPTTAVARELLGYGLKAHAGNLATILLAQLDVLFLTVMVSPHVLGNYAVASSAAITGSLVPVAVSLVLFPTFANQRGDPIASTLAHFILWGLAGALVLGVVLLLIVPWVVVPVYGPAFGAAAQISLILVPAYILRGLNQMLVSIIRGLSKPIAASVGQIVGLFVLGALLPIGITTRGLEGAALAVAISSIATFLCLVTAALKLGELSVHEARAVWSSDIARLLQLVRSPINRPRY